MRNEFRAWTRMTSQGWNRFWFAPTDPATLGLIRIFAGAMLFYTHLVWALSPDDFFGPDAWVTAESASAFRSNTAAWTYLDAFNSRGGLLAAHIGALIVLASFTLGLFSRTTSVLSFVIAVSYVNRLPLAGFGLDQVNTMLVMYLMVGPSGACYSLDAWLRRRKSATDISIPTPPSVSANIAIRMIQLHLCVIYLFAGMAKLEGAAWWDGSAMWLAIANKEYQTLDVTWLVESPSFLALLAHITIFWETFYCALVWPRFSRPIVIGMAIPMHLGIGMFLGMITFALAMLIGNLAFVPPHRVRQFFGWLSNWARTAGNRAGESRAPKAVERSPSASLYC